MPSVHKTVLLPYSAQQMFELVRNVCDYPQFLPWCGGAEVDEVGGDMIQATLSIDYHGLKQTFSTRNLHHAPDRITMTLVDGPFAHLDGTWGFHPLRPDACRVEFRLDYAFKNGLLSRALTPVFAQIARTMVDAFVRRAEQIHG
jgi:ribosome-associated toxin RatA of RatAB toxin-antitoxin module